MSIAVRHDNNHNAIAVHAPTAVDPINRLVEWAAAADAAYRVADKLCGTKFAPVAYRGKAQEATAAILAGAEVGLSPMASLRAFDDIQGTPAPKAITLRAIVQSLGHDVRIDESTDTVGVVSARRKGSNDWQTSTWTIQRAQQAGYPAKNANWKTAPAAMLIARATAEVCRWVASDAIMGMPYTSEEIRDEGGSYEPKPPAQRVTAAEVLGQIDQPLPAAVAATDDAIAAGASAPWQPGEREQMTAALAREPMTRAQQGKMHALFNEVGISDRGQRMQYVNEVLADVYSPDRQVSSSSELSKDETGRVIDKLQSWADSLEPTPAEVAEVVGDVR
jgi:hypothetical protein